MRKLHRLVALVLCFALIFTVPVTAKATEASTLKSAPKTKGEEMGDCYVYPYAQSQIISVVKGGSVQIQFKLNRAVLSSDIFVMEFYTEASEEPIEVKEYTVSSFRNGSLSVTWKPDYRYTLGEYELYCGIKDKNGRIYDQDIMVSLVEIVSGPVPANGIEVYRIVDGWLSDVVLSHWQGNDKVCLLPVLTPYTTTTVKSFTVTSSDPSAVRVSMDAGYVYVQSGGKIGWSTISIRCGNFSWETDMIFGTVTHLSATAAKNRLCVGETDAIRYDVTPTDANVTWKTSNSKVITVKDGKVTAVAPGSADVYVIAGDLQETLHYDVTMHVLPEGTPISTRTATQPAMAKGQCSLCGKKDAVNIYEAAIFTDTKSNAWYSGHVDYVYDRGIMKGQREHSFAPNTPVSRAMIATILYRIAGEPKVTGKSSFADVPSSGWYTKAVIWVQENGIVNGYSDGKFHPEDHVTREQIAAMFYRYTKNQGGKMSKGADLSGYPDADEVSSYARTAMKWAVGAGLITGKSSNGKTLLSPKTSASRAEIATIVSRYLQ